MRLNTRVIKKNIIYTAGLIIKLFLLFIFFFKTLRILHEYFSLAQRKLVEVGEKYNA